VFSIIAGIMWFVQKNADSKKILKNHMELD